MAGNLPPGCTDKDIDESAEDWTHYIEDYEQAEQDSYQAFLTLETILKKRYHSLVAVRIQQLIEQLPPEYQAIFHTKVPDNRH